jgi:hypothetical protein
MLAKAKLVEIKWDDKQKDAVKGDSSRDVEVHFNPQTLKVSYANENKGGDQPGGSSKQFVGSGTSKLAVELVFDTTQTGQDVRKITEKVAYFIQAKEEKSKGKAKRVPPGISFEWGSFIFRGVMDSLQESLDYFSEEGVPLRAALSLGISRHEIEFKFGEASAQAGGPAAAAINEGTPGVSPLQSPRQGDSLPELAGRSGFGADWKAIATANNIDDALRLKAGVSVDLNIGVQGRFGL